MKLKDFLIDNRACHEGTKWALENASTIHEAINHPSADFSHIRWAFIHIATKQEAIELALFCCDSVKHLMKDARSIAAVEAVRNGNVTEEIVNNAYDAASASHDASAYTAYDAASASNTAYTAYTASHAAYNSKEIKQAIHNKIIEILNRHEELKEE